MNKKISEKSNPNKLKSYKLQASRGYVALMSVIVAGAVGLSIATALLFSGINLSRTSLILTESNQARNLANACAESALLQINQNQSYTGSNSLTLGTGTCIYIVISNGGDNRTITASGTVKTTVRKISISINQITPNINISSWQEVAEF